MQKIIYILLFTTTFINAQVAIGKSSISSPSVSLEFGNDDSKGLILPWVTSKEAVEGAEEGTLIFDANDNKVKYFQVKNNVEKTWLDLTTVEDGKVNLEDQENKDEDLNAKVSIGKTISETPGILVLEDNDKAMVLPIVNKCAELPNPEAGLIVYDKTNKLFCAYNGTSWTFWDVK